MKTKKLAVLSLVSLMSVGFLAGCNEDGKLAEEVVNAIKLGSEAKQTSKSFTIPGVINHNKVKYDIKWTDNSDYIEVKEWDATHDRVVVTRPAAGSDNAEFTLTAEIDVNGKKATKDFKGSISAFEVDPVNFTKVTDIYDKFTTDKNFEGTLACLEGTIFVKHEDGLIIVDDENTPIQLYGAQNSYNVGDRVKVIGEIAHYHSMIQFGKGYAIDAISQNNKVTAPVYSEEALTPTQVKALKVAQGNPIHGKKLTVTGVLGQVGKYKNYAIKSVDNANDYVTFYHKTTGDDDKKILKPLLGKKVSIDVVYHTHHQYDGDLVQFFDDEEITSAALPADQQLKFNLSQYKAPKKIVSKLPEVFKSEDGTEYSVSYDGKAADGTVLVKTNGAIKTVEEDTKIKTLTVTLKDSEGTEVFNKTYEDYATLGKLEIVAVTDVYKDKKKEAFVDVNIVSKRYDDVVVEQDGKYYHVSKNDDVTNLTVGNKVILKVAYDYKDGDARLKCTEFVKNSSEKKFEPDYSKVLAPTDKEYALITAASTALNGVVDKTEGHKDIHSNKELKAALDAFDNKMFKLEGTVNKSGKFVDPVKPGFRINATSMTGLNPGDKVVVYGIVSGANIYKDTFKNQLNFYTTKVEKVAA